MDDHTKVHAGWRIGQANCEMNRQHDVICDPHATKGEMADMSLLLQGHVRPAGRQKMPLGSKVQKVGCSMGRCAVRSMHQ